MAVIPGLILAFILATGAGLVYEQYYDDPEALNVATVTRLVRNLSLLRTVGDMGEKPFGLLEPDHWKTAVAWTREVAEVCLAIAMASACSRRCWSAPSVSR